MLNQQQVSENVLRATVTLANAGELVANVIQNIAGNDISNSLNGNTATRELIVNMACRRISNNLTNRNM